MRVVVTGSSGRVGRAIVAALSARYEVVGVDRSPFATTTVVDDFTTSDLLLRALDGAGALIHTAALHAPHVGHVADREFHRINVDGSARLAERARASGVRAMVFTSTTALYGAVVGGGCAWIDEGTLPRPVSIYHRTKLEAETLLESIANADFAIRVIRMSRCFPEPAPAMAAYRLHRGVDVRDVADAHVLAVETAARLNESPRRQAALEHLPDAAEAGHVVDADERHGLAPVDGAPAPFDRFVVSGATPFEPGDAGTLAIDAPSVLALRAPDLVTAFAARRWPLPPTIDRVYASLHAAARLGWHARYGFDEVLAQLERRSLEVLPACARIGQRAE